MNLREGDVFDVIDGHKGWRWSGSITITKLELRNVRMLINNKSTGSTNKASMDRSTFEGFVAKGEVFYSKKTYVRRFIESL